MHVIYGRALRTDADCVDLLHELVGEWQGAPPDEDDRAVWNQVNLALEEFRAQGARLRHVAPEQRDRDGKLRQRQRTTRRQPRA
jgi:hypothetical protein